MPTQVMFKKYVKLIKLYLIIFLHEKRTKNSIKKEANQSKHQKLKH